MRYDRAEGEVVVDGFGALDHDGTTFVASIETVGPASVTALRHAVSRYVDDHGGPESLYVSPTPAEFFSEDYSPVEATSFAFSDDEIHMRTITHFGTELDEQDVERIAGIFLSGAGCVVRGFEAEGDGYDAMWTVTYEAPTRGKTVEGLLQIGKGLENLLSTLGPSGELEAESVLALVKAGSAEVLLGQVETEWLEVKSQAYRLADDGQKIELAQDVARFANAEGGGVLLIGVKTKKVGDLDVLRKVSPAPLDQLRPARYRKVIDRRVFPPVEGLQIEVHAASEQSGYLAIHIPPQPEELKPFLVHGAVVGGRVEGAFISIIRRRGEDSIPASPASIHSMLVAGRGLLRKPKEPPPPAMRHDR